MDILEAGSMSLFLPVTTADDKIHSKLGAIIIIMPIINQELEAKGYYDITIIDNYVFYD